MSFRIIAVRHAPAVEAGNRYSDRLRPLTAKSRKQFSRVLDGLLNLKDVKSGVVFTSPFVRAWQTAELLAQRIGAEVRYAEVLAPTSDAATVLKCLHAAAEGEPLVYAVGHNPDLSIFVARCIGAKPGALSLKKGGMAMVTFSGPVRLGTGELRWLLQPGQLRAIASSVNEDD